MEYITESYFGAEVKPIKYMPEINSYLVKINSNFTIYNHRGDDALGLSSIDIDDLKRYFNSIGGQ